MPLCGLLTIVHCAVKNEDYSTHKQIPAANYRT